jgi:periplasmic divalent cation tolerance protein
MEKQPMTPYIQVMTTVADQTSAEQLAAVLLEQRLAACIQITPCTSVYRWQGKIEQGVELVCTIKSRRDLFPALCRTIQAHHSYEVPEILAMPVMAGAERYLDWMEKELASAPEARD